MNRDIDPLGFGGYREFAPAPQQPTVAPTRGSKKKQKGFWTDQISTGGGIAGALAGGAGGAALGSVVPGVGTAIGGLIGAILGGAGGSAAGEFGENVATGEEDRLKNVGTEALLGGIFSAPPIRLAKGVIGAVKGAGSGAAREGFEKGLAGTKAALPEVTTQEPIKTSTQGKLQDWGNQVLKSQYGTIDKPTSRETNPIETIGQLADFGITKPDDAERLARTITGSDGLINRAVVKSVGKAGRINTDGLARVLDDAIENYGIVDKDAASLRATVRAQLKKLQGGPAGSLNPLANPTDAFEVMKNLEKRAADLRGMGGNYRMSTPERGDQAKVLYLLRDEIEDRLYNTAGANKNLASVLTPEFRNQLLSLQPNNQKWQGFVDQVMNSRSIGDLRSNMAPFVRVSKIIDNADMNALTFGGRTGNVANMLSQQGLTGMAASLATSLAKNPVARTAGTALREAGQRPVTNTNSLPVIKPAGVIGRLGTVGAIQGGANQLAQEPQGLEDALMQSSPTADQEAAPQQEATPYPRENLMADIQRDPENADKYVEYYQMLQEVYAPAGQQSQLNATQQKVAVTAQNALSDVDIIQQAIESGEIGKKLVPFNDNPVVGNVLGTNDINTALYNIGDVILRSRTGAQAPKSEVDAFVAGYLPRAGESRETQLYKLQRAYDELLGMVNPPAALGGGNAGGLEEALMSAYGSR